MSRRILGALRHPCSANCGNNISVQASKTCRSCNKSFCSDCCIRCPAGWLWDDYHSNGNCDGIVCVNCIKNGSLIKCSCCQLLACCISYGFGDGEPNCSACHYCDDGVPKRGYHKFGRMHGCGAKEAYETYRKVIESQEEKEKDEEDD